MAKGVSLGILLETEIEPSPKTYTEAVNDTIRNPQQISSLTEEPARGDVLILLKARSNRLAPYFGRLRAVVRQTPKSSTTSSVAAETVIFLLRMLPSINEFLLTEPTKVLEFLIPALDICFVPMKLPMLRELASILAEAGSLLEYVSSDRLGSEILRQWACTPNPLTLDAQTLEVWTQTFVKMVASCRKNHGVTQAIQQWNSLKTLKASLQSIKDTYMRQSKDDSGSVARHVLPQLGKMTQLSMEDKKARTAKRQTVHTSFPPLPDHLKDLLKAFDLQIPGSVNALQDAIKQLEGEKTTAILLSIATTFPCNLCIMGLESSLENPSTETDERNTRAISDLKVDIVDRKIGTWKVLLSPQALRSLLHMGTHGLADTAKKMLEKLVAGDWVPQEVPKAAPRSQTKGIKVPLSSIGFGRNHSILWQIDIGPDEETKLLQQMIIVWEVCEKSEIAKIVDRVVFIQRSYSDETVNRCLEHCSALDGKQIPACFTDSTSSSATSAKRPAEHDIRTVDQDVIDMTNKFYALTKPVMRSIQSRDLSAEFPFETSREEARVIGHFETASLILGRSGTGKTTCLVYKLMRKYLASKAVVGEKPVRQVLLTRSSFLAEKLRSYAQRLIETSSSKSLSLGSSRQKKHGSLMTVETNSMNDSALTLRDESFPRVYTWDSFLQVLENTTRIWRRQDFPELVGQVVDFYTFKVGYWPRFSHAITKDLSVNLVFAEFMGVIKGSASSAESLAPLPREEYLKRSCRMAPTFATEVKRALVYDLFELYETLKISRGDMDYIDRVVRVLKAMRQDPSLTRQLSSKFEEVYIDEIQDQRCLDIELLLSFIKDPRGLHFAGDTAQAISQDSTFRFSDIKGMFFQHFAAVSESTRQVDLARPELFTLFKNYRSHQGILSLASFVMGLIWKGFPETVDKLEPEIGNLSGPRPLLLIGVDFGLLHSSNAGHATYSVGTADFGAEQAILVRDTNTKIALQDQIGDVALVFTILDSKGMEFDDVILWNFFTDCPDQTGVRSLEILKNNPANFDPRKHGDMCSELKNLYVAVTRARNQLFMIEGSETTAAWILKLFADDASQALVDVTRPEHHDFKMKLDLMRPGSSMDPVGWRRRGDELMHQSYYIQARMCFRKANYAHGETLADAYILEEQGDSCKDSEGFTRNLEGAAKHFRKANLVEEAARVLAKLDRFEDAANLWSEHENHAEAARLFMKAGLDMKAFESFDNAQEYSEAAAILQKERKYDQLVSYLDKKREYIPANILRGYSLLCKLLLKQNKTSPDFRKHAIRVLGSLAEQEECFREYGMDDDLADLYVSQQRHTDLFHLRCRKGQLERALNIAIANDMLHSSADGLESEVLSLLDYVWIGHLQKSRQQQSAVPLKLPSGFLTPNIIIRAEQWEVSNLGYSLEGSIARQHVASMKSSMPKKILCLRKILDATAMTKTISLDDLPFEMMQEAVSFAKDLTLSKGSDTVKTMFLLAGIWKPTNSKENFSVLPWSPLREALSDASTIDPTKAVTQQVLNRLVSAILAFDSKARELWRKKWPTHCFRLMAIGICSRQRKGEECHQVHQLISAEDCSRKLDDLLPINSVFCDMAVLYYRRCVNEKFLEVYMSIKRHWLERILREFTYLSPAEQNTSAIMKAQAELCHDKRLIAISSFLEELLYHRVGKDKEWNKRSNFTSLLEQMQVAKALGSNVQIRLFRAVSHRLFNDKRQLMQRHLGQMNALREKLGFWDAPTIQHNLKLFLRNLDNIEVPALSTLHSLTAVFEYLATYLILKTCATACVIPNSWIDLHVASISKAITSAEPLQADDKHRYLECLIELAKSFCYILSRLNQAELTKDSLLCSGTSHPSMLLRQRNADLIAIMIANLAAASREPPNGFNELWARAKEVFEYPFIKAFHLRSRTPAELTQKLAPSFAKYNGKDALVVAIKDRKKGAAFSNLEQQHSVRTVSFDEICPPASASTATDDSINKKFIGSSTDEVHEQYTTTETDAIVKIQRLWRSCSPRIKRRHSYVSLPECQAITRVFNMGAHCPAGMTLRDRTTVRKLLVLQGVPLSLRLGAAREHLSKLQQDSMACVENVEVSVEVLESVDVILGRNREIEPLLKKAEEQMSEERLAGLVKLGVLEVLEKAVRDADDVIAGAELELLETRKMVDALLPKCT